MNRKNLCAVVAALLLVSHVACTSRVEPKPVVKKSSKNASKKSRSATTTTPEEAPSKLPPATEIGFATPEEAVDGIAKALNDGDAEKFRGIVARAKDYTRAVESLVIAEKREETLKQNMQLLASQYGFAGGLAKRFPAEIDGDTATVAVRFEDNATLDEGYSQWAFSKDGDQWYLFDMKVGKASELGDKYVWERTPADTSEEMKEFVAGISAGEEQGKAALAKFGEGAEVAEGFPVAAKSAIVVDKKDQDGAVCYQLNCSVGETKKAYLVCWKENKIVSIKAK